MSGENTSGIRPTEYKVLVEPKEVEKTTGGGLILPDDVVEKDGFSREEGILVAAAPMAFLLDNGEIDPGRPKIGERVAFAKYNATNIRGRDGNDYWIMNDKSIMAVID